MKAIWNGVVLAESEDTVLVDGDHYFPVGALNRDHVTFSNHKRNDSGRGTAHHFSLLVNGELFADAAWYYPEPTADGELLRDRVAFVRGVTIAP